MRKSYIIAIFTLISLQLLAQNPATNIPTNCTSKWYEGDGTQYGGVAGGSGGHCSLPVEVGDIYHAAMNQEQYANSNACGSCVRILGPKGEVTLKIVDECPNCKFGDIDVTTAVFPQLADMKDGRIRIKWQYVPCPKANDITILFATGTGPYYFKAQIRDANYPVEKVEYRKPDGTYETIGREVYNYFVAPLGIDENKQKTGPYFFRFTSFTGQVVDADSVIYSTTELVHTGVQFKSMSCPDCAGVINGNAQIDNCGVCSGGTTGIAPNSKCTKDCAGYWDGTAYIDGCGNCVSGTTGQTPCDNDCNNIPGGSAFIDRCGKCVGGQTNQQACVKDCNNKWGGTAYIDSCNKCVDGIILSNNTIKAETNLKGKLFHLFPNPTKQHITIDLGSMYSNVHLKIISSTGILLDTQTYEKTDRIQYNLPSPTGLYVLEVLTNEGVSAVFKVVKE